MSARNIHLHAEALVREYLAKRGHSRTLAALDEESPRGPDAISSRTALVHGLKIEKLVKHHKEHGDAAAVSLLEMVSEALILNERPLRRDSQSAPAGLNATAEPRFATQPNARAGERPHSVPASSASLAAGLGDRGARTLADGDYRSAASHAGGADRAGWSRPDLGGPGSLAAKGSLDGTLLVEEDIEDVDVGDGDFGSSSLGRSAPPMPSGAVGAGVRPRSLGHAAADALSQLFHGRPGAEWMASWVRQGFGFCDVPALPFGLRQHRGGTCGVIAAVQALLIRELHEHRPPLDPLMVTREQRDAALAQALAGALWRIAECAAGDRRVATPRAALVLFPGRMALPAPREMGAEATVLEFESARALEECVRDRLPLLQRADGAGVIAFAYACVLSAGGPDAVKAHMDATGLAPSTLLGAHGYCTQELVHLVVTGRATSNVFDGDKDLDGMTMHGIKEQAPVGVLSLFEHYGHVEVGAKLKAPRTPVWITFMESHYTVAFSRTPDAAPRPDGPFDLYYYDMLANQDYVIRLTVDPAGSLPQRGARDLVPPLEDTLRTKWKGAAVNWNGVDPLL